MTDAQVSTIVEALQIQVSRDFAQYWSDASLVFVAKGATPPHDAWVLAVLDNSDQADALGYHDLTPTGQPLGKAFAASDIKDGLTPSVTISHELLEMLADPEINMCAENDTTGKFYSYEVCDAVEDDSFGYSINGVLVSDFVLPAWFAPSLPGPWSFCKNAPGPFQLCPGGYISTCNPGEPGWTQVTAEAVPNKKARYSRDTIGTRRWRRVAGQKMVSGKKVS